jgi:hypothetical protein
MHHSLALRNRHLGLIALYGFITFGIYTLVWMATTNRELEASGSPRVLAFWFVLWSLLVPVITLIVAFLMNAAHVSDWQLGSVLIIFFASLPVALAMFLWWTWRYAVAAEAVIGAPGSRKMIFWMGALLWLFGFHFLWPVIVQDKYNNLLRGA